MKKFGSLFKKNIVKILILIIVVQFSIQPASQASVGGVLFTPIQDLVMALGDVGEAVLGMVAYGSSDYAQSVVKLTKNSNKTTGDDINSLGIFKWWLPATVAVAKLHLIRYIGKNIHKTFSDKDFTEFIELPVMSITPDKIFSNDIPILNVNIINPPKPVKDDKGNTQKSVVYTLQSTISTWYVVLRNIAIVAMLSILVYVGIRIIISSAAEDKAKYKEMLKDWLIGLCLIFLMHYGMSFMLEFNNAIIGMLAENNKDVIIAIPDENGNKPDKFSFADFTKDMSDDQKKAVETYNVDDKGNPDTNDLHWHTDMAGQLRFLAQTNIKSNTALVRFGYTVMYFVLVIYTWMFFIKYLVRVLHIIFLTLIAPVVAMAYPLDKMGDGSAQAFNSWVKEYIFTLLMQPMHMILYTILISSAMQLAVDHPIYGMVVFGVMLQLEKMVKKIFGFDRAPLGRGEAGSFAGAFTGSTVMHGLNNAFNNIGKHKLPPPPGGGPKGGGSDGSGRVRYSNNRTADANAGNVVDAALGGLPNPNSNSSPNRGSNTQELPVGSAGDNPGPIGTLPNGTNAATQEYADYNIGNGNNNPNLSAADQDYLDWNMGSGLPAGNDQPIRTQNVEQFSDTQPRPDMNSGNNENGGSALEGDSGESSNPNLPSGNSGEVETVPQIRVATNNRPGIGQMNGNPYIGQNNGQRRQLKSKPRVSAPRAVWRAYAKPILKTVGKAGIRMAGAATLAGVGATVGVAAGLATDDMTNVAKGAAAGITGGAVAGDVIAKNTMNGIPRAGHAIADAANRGADAYRQQRDDPEQYQAYLNQKADNEYRKSKETQDKFTKAFGASESKERIEQSIRYRQNGVTDTDLIIKAMKLDSGAIGKTASTSKERIAAAKLASGVSNSKDVNSMQSRLEKKGYNKQLVEQNMEAVRKLKGLENN